MNIFVSIVAYGWFLIEIYVPLVWFVKHHISKYWENWPTDMNEFNFNSSGEAQEFMLLAVTNSIFPCIKVTNTTLWK